MKRFGLIGFPLGHSFSKKYFEEKFVRENISDAVFELCPIPSIEDFPQLIASQPDWVGLSVTIPYKHQVIPYLDELALPEGVGACNSIKVESGRLIGYNTDVVGFEKSFSELLTPEHRSALVLGNGGAAEAVVHVLKKLNIDYQVVSRTLHGTSSLTYADIDADVIHGVQVIINCSPLGTFPKVEECPAIPYEFINQSHYLFDLVYNPSKTLFLKRGEERGATIKNGYDMLAIQAEASWQIWNAPPRELP